MQPGPQWRVLNDQIIELWKKEHSSGMIAYTLSVTRGVVMGVVSRAQKRGVLQRRKASPIRLVHRGGVKDREARSIQARLAAQSRWANRAVPVADVPVVSQPALQFPDLDLPSGAAIAWHAARGCCHLAGDDPRNPQWCNAPVWERSSWCPSHYREVFRR